MLTQHIVNTRLTKKCLILLSLHNRISISITGYTTTFSYTKVIFRQNVPATGLVLGVSTWLMSMLPYIIAGVNAAKPKRVFCLAKQTGKFALQSFNQLLWPAVCINCRESICETDNSLCKNCWDQLLACTGADYCRRCGRDAGKFALLKGACPDCQGKEIRFDCIARSGVYNQSLRKMVLALKNGRTELDSVLGFLANSALQGSGFYDDVELFVPVPLHWSRRLARGYNQSQVLVRKLTHPTAKTSTELVRVRRTKAQPTMPSPAARLRNVAGAFAVRCGHNCAGRKICLVDDVKTTGATLNECAKTLKQAGASEVFALVLAVAGQSPAEPLLAR
jgi:ComF family protein